MHPQTRPGLRNLTLEDAACVVAGLRAQNDTLVCPICDRPMKVSENAEQSPFWSHFFSKKHAAYRPLDPALEPIFKAAITKAARDFKKDMKALEKALKNARVAQAQAETARQHATHTVSGAFLDSVVEEMQSLISMMEPYYSQANADKSARAKIAEIRAITGHPAAL